MTRAATLAQGISDCASAIGLVSGNHQGFAEFDDIKELRTLVRAYGPPRLSDASRKEYAKKSRTLNKWRDQDGGQLDIARHCGSQRSFDAYRAAAIWGAIEQAKDDLRRRDKTPRNSSEYLRLVQSIRANLALLRRYQMRRDGQHFAQWQLQERLAAAGLDSSPAAGEYRQARAEGRVSTQKHHDSKLAATNKLNRALPDWRAKLHQHLLNMQSPWALWAAVQSVTGCRPAEIPGIRIIPFNNGALFFAINGAKVDANKGQPQRRLILNDNSPEFAYLCQLLAQHGNRLEVGNTVAAEQLVDPVAAYEAAMRRAGASALGKKWKFSAYCFRHALAADLKAEGTDREQLALILGHSVTETATLYGRTSGGQRGMRKITATGDRVVKINHRDDFSHLSRKQPRRKPARSDSTPSLPRPAELN